MIRIEAAAATHVGRVRETNQDRALVTGQLAAVADGMGGHAGGDKAAALAIAELSGVRGTVSADRLIKVVQAANRRIFKVASAPELRGMGTTIVAAVVDNTSGVMSLINVGDSRGYQFRNGVLRQVTEDHSLVEDLLRSGRLTEAEAKVHPQRNIVTRVLGIGEAVDVDLFSINLEVGDRYVLCSDGLTNEVDNQGIVDLLERFPSAADAADELVSLAVQNGGRDNVTVAVVDILPAQDDDQTEAARTRGQRETQEIAPVVAPDAGSLGGPALPDADGESIVGDSTGTTQTLLKDDPSDLFQDGAGNKHEGTEPGDAQPDDVGAEPGSVTVPDQGNGPRSRLRSVMFVAAVIGVALLAVLTSSWYARSSWYADDLDGEVVILRGRPGGFLWYDPAVVVETGIDVAELDGTAHELLTSQSSWPSLADASEFVDNLKQDSDPVAED